MNLNIEKIYRAAFRAIPGIGSQRLRQLIAWFGSAAAAWDVPKEVYLGLSREQWVINLIKERERINLKEVEKNLERHGIALVIPDEPHYPGLLAEVVDAPPLLYYKGNLKPNQEALAVVGSRKCTAYGRAAAEYLARETASKGIAIVSGLARGIDTEAHKGALACGGVTWAVLGNGLDQIYPPENKNLAAAILEKGAILSEFPPGTPPEPKNFPARNRIISGVARGVLVVEAALKSGALITVDFALEQGREVFAVPGPIFSEMSKGTHNLIRQGAKIVEGVEDVWSEIPSWLEGPDATLSLEKTLSLVRDSEDDSQNNCEISLKDNKFTKEYREILELLSDVPVHIDQIVMNSGFSAAQVALVLLELQLEGKIEQLPGQYYVLARRC